MCSLFLHLSLLECELLEKIKLVFSIPKVVPAHIRSKNCSKKKKTNTKIVSFLDILGLLNFKKNLV